MAVIEIETEVRAPREERCFDLFRSFVSDHYFEPKGQATRMRQVVVFRSPLGLLGRIVDAVYLSRYLRALQLERQQFVKAAAEAGDAGPA